MTSKRFSEAEGAEIWDSIERGESMRVIGRRLGRVHGSIRSFLWTTPVGGLDHRGALNCG
jgi:IS30 family transposase